jgi:selT/selW/selH-like putative selenoprotein
VYVTARKAFADNNEMKPQLHLLLLLLLALLFVVKASEETDGFDDEPEDISRHHIKDPPSVIGLNPYKIDLFVSYCIAWQGRGSFEQLKKFLESHYPQQIVVRGASHPPTKVGEFMLQASQVAQGLGMLFALGGDQFLLARLGNQLPWLHGLVQNKMQLLLGSFMFSSVAQSFAKTDAFEIFCNGDKIFSKLETKRMPNLDELMRELHKRGLGGGGEYQQPGVFAQAM